MRQDPAERLGKGASLLSSNAITDPNRVGCPSEADHRAFLLGDLSEERADRIAAHLEICAACEARSQEIDNAADAVVSALRHAIPLASTLSIRGGTDQPGGASAAQRSDIRYVAGHEIIAEVGRGGMGVVFKARQVRLNRVVALKMILAGPFAAAEELVRFQVEGETLARLSHPSIVPIYEIGQLDGRPFFTMEWVEGGTLADRFSGQMVESRMAATLLEEIARAVQYAHESGVVHRDLKPANILLAGSRTNPTPHPKVTDFGLAKPTWGEANLTATGVAIGTPGYMAPEQARGDRLVGPAADVYSLGAILYELLTGRPPFPLPGTGRASPAEVIGQVLDREPAPPRRLNKSVPRDLATICLHCLDKAPAARYASAGDLADDLRRYLNGEAVKAHPSGEVRRVWKWARRRPVIAGLLAAVAASLLLGAVVSTYFAFMAHASEQDALQAQEIAVRNEVTAVAARNQAHRELARSDFHEGCRRAELGRVGEGLHWMLTALRQVPDEVEDQSFREMVRLNIGAWSERLSRLRHVVTLPEEVNSVDFSPDGRMFAVGSHDRSVRLFDTETGEPVGPTLQAESRVNVLAFSPDGRYLITGGEAGYQQGEYSRVSRFDVIGRHALPPAEIPDNAKIDSIAFDRESQTFLVAGQIRNGPSALWLCKADTGKCMKTAAFPSLKSNYGRVATRQLGPGFMVVACSEEAPIYVAVHDGANLSPWVEVDKANRQTTLTFRDADRLTVGDRTGVRCYEVADGRAVPQSPKLGGSRWFAESPDGRFRAADVGSAFGPLRLWDVTTGITTTMLSPEDSYRKAVFSPDGRRLLASSLGGRARLWDLAVPSPRPDGDGEPTRAPARHLKFVDVAFSRDRDTAVLAAPGVARIWKHGQGMAVLDLPQHTFLFGGRSHLIGLSREGRQLTALESGQSMRIWDVETARPLASTPSHWNAISVQALNPSGNILATGDYDRLVYLWDVPTGKSLGPPLRQTDIVFGLEFSPDGRTLAVSSANDWQRVHGVRLWHVASRKQIGELLPTGGSTPARLAFNRDSTQLLTAASDGVRRWDTRTGLEVGSLIPHAGGANSIAFDADGRLFVTGSRTGMVRLWDADTGRAIGTAMSGLSSVTAMEFHPDGRHVAVGYADGTARLWDVRTSQPVGPPIAQPAPILCVTFPAGGRVLRTAAGDGTVRDWPLAAPFLGTTDELEQALAHGTGIEMDGHKLLLTVSDDAWNENRGKAPFASVCRTWNRDLAWDAEQAGNPEAARWHLDHLIAQEPTDWELHARRGRATLDSGRSIDADADYQKAVDLAPPGALAAWYRQCSTECRAAERWDAARWYLDRLVVFEPDNWRHYTERSDVFRRLGRTDLADRDRDAGVSRGAEGLVVIQLAEERAHAGHWAEAARLFQQARPTNPLDMAHAATVYLKAGDVQAYQTVCQLLVDRTESARSRWRANFVASLCSLAPAGSIDLTRPLALSIYTLEEPSRVSTPVGVSAPERPEVRRNYLNTLGSILVRSGRYQEGIERLNEAIKVGGAGGTVHDWLFLAIAHDHLGNPGEAARWLNKVKAHDPPATANAFWHELEVQILRTETERLRDNAR